MKYYDSIDTIPLFNWRRMTDGDLKYSRINIEKGSDQKDLETFTLLMDQYYEEFGIGEDYKRVLELMVEIAKLQCEYCIDGQAFTLNRITILKEDLKEILERPVEGTLDDCLVYLSKWLGFRLDQKAISVKEFYKYLEAYQKEATILKEKQQKKS